MKKVNCGPDCLGQFCKCRSLPPKKKVLTDVSHNKSRSVAQEGRIAKSYQSAGFPRARRVPMSGALAILPGDVDPGELLLVEAKQTRTGKLVIREDWLLQVEQQSHGLGRRGWYALHAWAAGDGQYRKVVVLPEALYFELLKRYMNERNQSQAGDASGDLSGAADLGSGVGDSD